MQKGLTLIPDTIKARKVERYAQDRGYDEHSYKPFQKENKALLVRPAQRSYNISLQRVGGLAKNSRNQENPTSLSVMNKRMSTIETGSKTLKQIEERKKSFSTMKSYDKNYSKYENNYDFLN